MRGMEIPAYPAALLLAPTVLKRKPSVVRESIHQARTASATAMMNPIGIPPTALS